MKTFIRKSAIAASLIIALAASSFQSIAQDNTLIYNKTHNTSIGITVENAAGASYLIKDEKGNIVLQGKVKNDKTFYISTAKLNSGSYRFCIGSFVLQEFVIR